MIKNKKGLVLIAAIMLVVFVSITVLGLSTFIVGWYKQIYSAEIEERCIYNAMAGINYALYQYRKDATHNLTNGTFNIDGMNFTLSTVASGGGGGGTSSLVVNATGAYLGDNGRILQGVTIRNSSASPITINKIVVTWTGSNRMANIQLNGSTVWSGSAYSSPATVNISNTTIPANTTFPINLIQFNNPIFNANITLSFVMTGGITTTACTAWPSQGSVCIQSGTGLTIKSMGKTAGSNQYRSVQATYTIASGNVSDYGEISQTVP
ncbi:MAG: hypothetical protein PHW44_02185 [Candidatus Omnitrophica bacterium]|nr:hypothetical protein [Candidatus Omnitrophota bacterium]